MAVKRPYMVKGNMGAATASLSIQAKPDESLRIKGLKFGALTSGGYIECFIDRLSVGFFYAGDINANHVEQWSLATLLGNVFDRLIALGIHKGFPVAPGQTFEVKPRVAGNVVIGQIIYEVGEAADFKQDAQNGTLAKEFVYLNYGTNGSIIAAAATGVIDTPRNPSEYPAFPFGAVVPAKQQVEILGMLLMDWKDSQGNLNPNYSYIKLVKDRETLFDEDRNGIYVREGMGLLTWGPCRQTNVDIEMLPAPLVFQPGDELLVQMTAGDEIAANDIMFAVIERVTMIA